MPSWLQWVLSLENEGYLSKMAGTLNEGRKVSESEVERCGWGHSGLLGAWPHLSFSSLPIPHLSGEDISCTVSPQASYSEYMIDCEREYFVCNKSCASKGLLLPLLWLDPVSSSKLYLLRAQAVEAGCLGLCPNSVTSYVAVWPWASFLTALMISGFSLRWGCIRTSFPWITVRILR